MPKPRRRRRFFALEGRFEVDNTGELQGLAEPAQEPASDPDPPAEETEAAAGFGPGPGSADETLPPAFQLNRTPRVRTTSRRFLTPGSLLLAFVCLAAGLLAGRWWPGNMPAPAAAASGNVPKELEPLTAADQESLDAAYAARHAYNFPEADRLFAELNRRHPDWGPVQIETGRTLFYAGRGPEAMNMLRRAADKGWKPAEATFLLAMIDKGWRHYIEAEQEFARAVATDPTVPDYYFFWGECLREQGKLMEATAKFRSALLRNQYETATGLYRVKVWLCAIEADQPGSQVNAEVDADLASAHPTMEGLVAAAARDLRAHEWQAAEGHLTAASQRADPIVFRYVLGDPEFADARTRPELAAFFQPAPPRSPPAQ